MKSHQKVYFTWKFLGEREVKISNYMWKSLEERDVLVSNYIGYIENYTSNQHY